MTWYFSPAVSPDPSVDLMTIDLPVRACKPVRTHELEPEYDEAALAPKHVNSYHMGATLIRSYLSGGSGVDALFIRPACR